VRRASALKLKCDAWLRPNQPRDVRQDIITQCMICYFTRTWSVIYHLDFRDTWTSLTFNESWQTWHHFLFFFVLFFTPDLIFVELHGAVSPNNCNTIGRSQSKTVQICTRTTSFSVILLILSTDIFGSVSDHIEIRLSYIISERMSSQTVETTRLVILILCRVTNVILVNNYHFGGKCLEYFLMHFCYWIHRVLLLTTLLSRVEKVNWRCTYISHDWGKSSPWCVIGCSSPSLSPSLTDLPLRRPISSNTVVWFI